MPVLKTLQEMAFHSLSLVNSTYPCRIWENSFTSYARTLAENSMSEHNKKLLRANSILFQIIFDFVSLTMLSVKLRWLVQFMKYEAIVNSFQNFSVAVDIYDTNLSETWKEIYE